jgi:hypothetical protein
VPKVHRVKARIDSPQMCPHAQKGQVYYWWKNRMKGMKEGVVKCTVGLPPRRSQLTLSEYVSGVLQIQEEMDYAFLETVDDFIAARDEWAQQIRELADEQDDKLNNMPEQFQESDTACLLEERRDALNEWAEELERIDVQEPNPLDYGDTDEDGVVSDGEESEEYQEDVAQAIADAVAECSGLCPE